MAPPSSRWVPWAITALAAVALSVHAWPSWDTTVDDAWITARYAEQLASGNGLLYNAPSSGSPSVEGITNTGWAILLAAGRVVGLPMQTLLPGLGWAFGVASLFAATGLVQALSGRQHPVTATAAVVMCLSPHYAVATTNGLETSMMVALTLTTLWWWIAAQDADRGWAGAAAAALVWTRPEALAVVGLLGLHDVVTHRRDLRGALPFTGVALAALAALEGFRLLQYGELLPNTFAAKAHFPWARTLEVNADYLTPRWPILYGGAATLALGAILPPWTWRKAVVVVLTLVLAAAPFTVNLWMPGLRLFLTPLALAAVLAAAGTASLKPKLGWALALAASGLMGWTLIAWTPQATFYDWRHSVRPVANPAARNMATDADGRENGAAGAGRHLAAHLPAGSWLAIRDAGHLAYWAGPDVHVAELHQRALTLPHPGGQDALVLDHTPVDPAVIVTTLRRAHQTRVQYGNDRRVFQRTTAPYRYLGRVHQHFHRFYDIYVRGDLPVPPLPPDLIVNRLGPPPVREAPELDDLDALPLRDTATLP